MLVRSHFYQDFVFSVYSSDYSLEGQFVKDSPYHGAQGLMRTMTTTGENTLLISAFDYNIYKLSECKVQKEYYIDFGKYEMNKEVLTKNGMSGVWKEIGLGKSVSSPIGIAERYNYLWFYVMHSKEPISYFYSSSKKKHIV